MPLPDLIPKSIDEAANNVLGPITKGMGKALEDIFLLCFGWLGFTADKRRIKYKVGLEKFAEDVCTKTKAVPTERLIEPNTQIVMNAMNDARSCVEDDDLRGLFANLIASSVDSAKASFVHPSFSGAISRMSANDARNLTLFKHRANFPIVRMELACAKSGDLFEGDELIPENDLTSPLDKLSALKKSIADFEANEQAHKKGGILFQDNVFLGNPGNIDIKQQAASITYLESLGFIRSTFLQHLVAEDEYSAFDELPVVKGCKALLDGDVLRYGSEPVHEAITVLQNSSILSSIILATKPAIAEFREMYKELRIAKGMVSITPIGKQFLDVCT